MHLTYGFCDADVVVLNIPARPPRHDLIKESIVNKEIRKGNVDINTICK
jgi:hypothetical protein